MIRIVSKQDGFRRCGVAHSKAPTEYPDKAFTAKQLEILQAEPMLVVQLIDGEDDEGGNNTKRLNAKDSITAIKAAVSIEDLDKLAEGEDRQSVVGAIAKRRAELKPPAE